MDQDQVGNTVQKQPSGGRMAMAGRQQGVSKCLKTDVIILFNIILIT